MSADHPPRPARQPEAPTSVLDTVDELDVRAGESPDCASVPFWVTACVRLAPPRRPSGEAMDTAADKVLTAAQVLVASQIRGYDRAEVTPDTALIARMVGYSRADRARWILDYLQEIGFLRVVDGGVRADGVRMARHDTATGRKITNTYVVHQRPPRHYRGPRTLAELATALSYAAGDGTPVAGLFAEPQVGTYTAHEGDTRQTYPADAGDTKDPQLDAYTPSAGTGPATYPTHAGSSTNPQVATYPADAGSLDREREGTPSREFPPSIEESREAGSGRPAKPADPGTSPSGRAWDVIVRLPWPAGGRPTRHEAAVLAELVDAAIAHELTYGELAEHLRGRLNRVRAGGNAIAYVRGALAPERLPVPTPTEPDAPATGHTDTAGPAAARCSSSDRLPPRLPACSVCGAEEGAPKNHRIVETADGRETWCECYRPTTPLAATTPDN